MKKENWDGWLVAIKDELLDPGEIKQPMVVLEDRDDKILIQQLPQNKYAFSAFLYTECVLKDWVDIIDKEIQKY